MKGLLVNVLLVLSAIILNSRHATADIGKSFQLVSVSVNGGVIPGWSYGPVMSSDGRYIAFTTDGSEAVPYDNNGRADVFLRDTQLQTTELISVSTGGQQGNGNSSTAAMSRDGRFIAFLSAASNLVEGDTNGVDDLFLRDRIGGTTVRVSLGSGGVQANGRTFAGAISDDGRFISFLSHASNLDPSDVENAADAYLRDIQSGKTTLLSGNMKKIPAFPVPMEAHILSIAMSGDGSKVVFAPYEGPTSRSSLGVWMHDVRSGTRNRVDMSNLGEYGSSMNEGLALSVDGRYFAFTSWSSELVADDTNGTSDVFFRDMSAGTIERVNFDEFGRQMGRSYGVSISDDGRYLGFNSQVQHPDFGPQMYFDLYVRDRLLNRTAVVNHLADGSWPNNSHDGGGLSHDGSKVVLTTGATNYTNTPGDSGNFKKVVLTTNDTFEGTWTEADTGEALSKRCPGYTAVACGVEVTACVESTLLEYLALQYIDIDLYSQMLRACDYLLCEEQKNEMYTVGYKAGVASVNIAQIKQSAYAAGFSDGVASVDKDALILQGFEAGVASINQEAIRQEGYTQGYSDGLAACKDSIPSCENTTLNRGEVIALLAEECPCASAVNHGRYVSCVSKVLEDLLERSLIDASLQEELQNAAAKALCGKKAGEQKG